MAADNDDAYNLSPGFILETVEATKKFITRDKKSEFTHQALARFLAWPVARVMHAIAQLGAIERQELSREAVKKLSTQRQAIALHSEVQKAKKRGEPIPAEKQERLVARAVQPEKARAEVAIKDEVAVEMHPLPSPIEQKSIEFTKYLSKAIDKLTAALIGIRSGASINHAPARGGPSAAKPDFVV